MAVNLKGRDFLKLLDFSEEEITYFLDLAADLKDCRPQGQEEEGYPSQDLRGQEYRADLREDQYEDPLLF